MLYDGIAISPTTSATTTTTATITDAYSSNEDANTSLNLEDLPSPSPPATTPSAAVTTGSSPSPGTVAGHPASSSAVFSAGSAVPFTTTFPEASGWSGRSSSTSPKLTQSSDRFRMTSSAEPTLPLNTSKAGHSDTYSADAFASSRANCYLKMPHMRQSELSGLDHQVTTLTTHSVNSITQSPMLFHPLVPASNVAEYLPASESLQTSLISLRNQRQFPSLSNQANEQNATLSAFSWFSVRPPATKSPSIPSSEEQDQSHPQYLRNMQALQPTPLFPQALQPVVTTFISSGLYNNPNTTQSTCSAPSSSSSYLSQTNVSQNLQGNLSDNQRRNYSLRTRQENQDAPMEETSMSLSSSNSSVGQPMSLHGTPTPQFTSFNTQYRILQQEHDSLSRELQQLKESNLCRVCLDRESNAVFMPCAHLMVCVTCASQLAQCPLCRAPIHYTYCAKID